MNNIYAWIIIIVMSFSLGAVQFMTLDKTMDGRNKSTSFRLFEFWRIFISYIFTGVIGYYFLDVRWPRIIGSGAHIGESALTIGDFVLGLIFLIGITGWIGFFIKNVTMGITAIIERVLSK